MTKRNRLEPAERRKQLLDVALALAEEIGYKDVNRMNLAAQCDVSPSLISHYYDSTENLRGAIVRAAVRRENVAVVAQGLSAKHPDAMKASDELKELVAQYILS
jgi:AcrR family transcriptional regulator